MNDVEIDMQPKKRAWPCAITQLVELSLTIIEAKHPVTNVGVGDDATILRGDEADAYALGIIVALRALIPDLDDYVEAREEVKAEEEKSYDH